MTPTEEAAAAQRRWIIVRLGGSVLFLALIVLGFVLAGPLNSAPAGIAVIIVAIVFRIALPFVATRLGTRGLPTTRLTGTADTWWYNHRTGEVEQGPQSLGLDRDGPYATREDAMRAPEIARERAAKWNAED
jgi:hypothetical protein